MIKPAAFLGLSGGLLLLLGAAGSPPQKPADPPVAAKAAPARDSDPPQPAGFPGSGESLHYSVNWPGGASLGEAYLRSAKTGDGWQFEFSLNASVPGFAVSDQYHSRANADFCSLELEKQATHGSRTAHERTVFDYKDGKATRTTLTKGGGHTDIDVDGCARDGLDYVFYARRELALGHGVPKEQDVLFGAPYSVRMEYAGVQDVTAAGKRRQADHIVLYVKGPASDSKAEMFFARDAARTPLMVKVPFALGTFSMELVR